MANEKFYWCSLLNKACFTSYECTTGTKLLGCPTAYQNRSGDEVGYTISFTQDSRMTVNGLKLQWVTDHDEEKGCELCIEE
jgi:hypothetical protein